MAPIQGHLMVPKAMRIVKFAIAQAKSLIRTKVPTAGQTHTPLTAVRAYTQTTIAIHPTALLKQTKSSRLQSHNSRLYTNSPHSRNPTSGPKYDRSAFPSSRTSRRITQNGTAPFASTLRPNLTGGTLPRSAGGYTLGGAGRTRQFSHTSGCQAQVVQNVSAGIRAFLVNGSKARFDGIDPVTGEKHWKAVTETQNDVYKKSTAAPYSSPRGTSLDFQLSPTVTALLPTSSSALEDLASSTSAEYQEITNTTINSAGILRTLSSDFARAFRDLALITHDLSKLAAFGDLPLILVHTPSGPLLRVRFPGCDADAVSALCSEVDIRRGVIVEDASWTESRDADMALLFPFAPAETPGLDSTELADYERGFFGRGRNVGARSHGASESSLFGEEERVKAQLTSQRYNLLTPSLSSSPEEGYTASLISESSGYEDSPSLLPSSSFPIELSSNADSVIDGSDITHTVNSTAQAAEYEGVEGIYRFLQEIDDARRERRSSSSRL